MAKTKALKKSSFMGQKKAKNHHVSFEKEPSRLARAAFPFRLAFVVWLLLLLDPSGCGLDWIGFLKCRGLP